MSPWWPSSLVRITAITYNLNGRKAISDQIRYLIDRGDEHVKGGDGANDVSDIVVIGMQELSHAEMLGAVALDETWVRAITVYMSGKSRLLLARTHLASNVLLVYARAELLAYVDRVDSRYTRSTFYGLTGHKGTISLRLTFKDQSSLVFLTSHLSANREGYGRRLAEYRAALPCTFENENEMGDSAVIWLGDLNFRLIDHESCEEVETKLRSTDESAATKITRLIDRCDQLRQAQKIGEAFAEFQEAKIEFLPTYRITDYDNRRIPAWCDRILYRGEGLKCLQYTSDRRITLSDHFPVIAHFDWQSRSRREKKSQDVSSRRGPEWNCLFDIEPSSNWYDTIPFACRFRFVDNYWKRHGSYMDWIGIYSAEMPDFYRSHAQCVRDRTRVDALAVQMMDTIAPITSIYLLACTDVKDDADGSRWTHAQFPALPPGDYRVGYWSWWRGCVHGLSEVFHVIAVGNEVHANRATREKEEM